MTIDEVIDIIKKYDINGCGYCHQGGDEVREAFEMAIEALEQEPKTEWIPVSERLPEVGIDVLICNMEGAIYLSHRLSTNSYFDELGNKIKNIRAWMPLPEPYKAESEVEE